MHDQTFLHAKCLEDLPGHPHCAHPVGDHTDLEHSLAAKVGDLKSGRLTTQATSNAVMSDEELAIHDATFKKIHQLTVSISELATNLGWQGATRVSEIDIFSPWWTNAFVCLQNLGFFKEFTDEKNSEGFFGVSTLETHEATVELTDRASMRFFKGSSRGPKMDRSLCLLSHDSRSCIIPAWSQRCATSRMETSNYRQNRFRLTCTNAQGEATRSISTLRPWRMVTTHRKTRRCPIKLP